MWSIDSPGFGKGGEAEYGRETSKSSIRPGPVVMFIQKYRVCGCESLTFPERGGDSCNQAFTLKTRPSANVERTILSAAFDFALALAVLQRRIACASRSQPRFASG